MSQSERDSEDERRNVWAAMQNAIKHMETIESGLEPFDREKNREARERLSDARDQLEEI